MGVLALAGCQDAPGPGPGELLTTAIVSNPVPAAAASAARSGASFSIASGPRVAYVSLPPGTFANGVLATISDPRTGGLVTVRVVDGGFDPVAVPAAAGDTLELDITVRDSSGPLSFALPVPATRPPVVVRTEPPPKKRDVALNSAIVVVFSEPIDPATLTLSSVQLLSATAPVMGRLEFRDATHVTAEFIPQAPLTPGGAYDLMVTQEIHDLDGEPLDSLVIVSFAAAQPVAGQLAFTNVQVTTDIFLLDSDSDRAAPRRVTNDSANKHEPRWSPDGKRLVFGRSFYPPIPAGMYVINADGSGQSQLSATEGYWPSWSPDGKRIAFGDNVSIYTVGADGSAPSKLTSSVGAVDLPMWSPRDLKIAFHVRGDERLYVMNADGTGVSMVTNVVVYSFAWSPDGTRFAFVGGAAFVGGRTDDRVLGVVNVDGSGLAALTPLDASSVFSPAWSPDGTKIIFTKGDIYTINADGTGLTDFANTATAIVPVWSPDAVQISFRKTSGGLYLMNADGTGIRRLVTGTVLSASWNPAGTSLR